MSDLIWSEMLSLIHKCWSCLSKGNSAANRWRHKKKLWALPSLRQTWQLTCTVLNLLFHWSPLMCTSIVFRDRGLVMSQSLLFPSQLLCFLSGFLAFIKWLRPLFQRSLSPSYILPGCNTCCLPFPDADYLKENWQVEILSEVIYAYFYYRHHSNDGCGKLLIGFVFFSSKMWSLLLITQAAV